MPPSSVRQPAPPPDEHELSLLDHLTELRDRLFRAVIALALAFPIVFAFAPQLRTLLAQPMMSALKGPLGKPIATGALDPLMLDMKLSLIGAVFVTSPFLAYQIWAFVAPGLYAHEKRWVWPFLTTGTFFFIAGAAFCHAFVMPVIFRFGVDYMGDDVIPMLDIGTNLAMTAQMMLAFGIVFEMPVVIFLLALAGLVTVDGLARFRRYAIVATFVIAAILTPPDVVSQIMMALPMLVLFELGVLAARFVAKKEPAPEGTPIDTSQDATPPAE